MSFTTFCTGTPCLVKRAYTSTPFLLNRAYTYTPFVKRAYTYTPFTKKGVHVYALFSKQGVHVRPIRPVVQACTPYTPRFKCRYLEGFVKLSTSEMSKRNVQYVKQNEPSFIAQFKKNAGFKEDSTVDTKVLKSSVSDIEGN